MKIVISYSSVNDGQWGNDTSDEAAERVARNVTDLAKAYAQRHWPEAEVEARVHDSLQPDAVRCFGHPDSEEIGMDIERYISDHWYEEAVWEENFDAAAYLAAHPA